MENNYTQGLTFISNNDKLNLSTTFKKTGGVNQMKFVKMFNADVNMMNDTNLLVLNLNMDNVDLRTDGFLIERMNSDFMERCIA